MIIHLSMETPLGLVVSDEGRLPYCTWLGRGEPGRVWVFYLIAIAIASRSGNKTRLRRWDVAGVDDACDWGLDSPLGHCPCRFVAAYRETV